MNVARKPARSRRRVVLAAVALAVAVLLAEGALRVAAEVMHRTRGVAFDPVLGWRMLPGIEKWGEFWSAKEPGRTNEHGWRDRSRTLAKPAGVRRLVVLGDSFTFGQGVDARDRFTDRLELDTGWQVLNFGCCAYGTDQEVLVYEQFARDFAPDAAVLAVFLGNDLDDIRLERQSGWPKPWFRRVGDDFELVPPPHDWRTSLRTHSYLAEVVLQWLDGKAPAARQASEWRDADTLPLFGALVHRLHDAVQRDGAQLLVMLLQPCDASGRTIRHARTDDVLAALRSAGIDVFDTHASFAAGGEACFLANGHWSPAGHEVAAAALRAELAQHAWFSR